MKTDTRHRTTFGTRFRFLVRVLALFAVLAVAAGSMVAVPSFPAFRGDDGNFTVDHVKTVSQAIIEGKHGASARVAGYLLLGGAAALALWLLVELLSALTLLTGRKTASGTNAAVQVALATALLVVVNALSFEHYQRWDKTRDHEFTINDELKEKLAKLDPKTPTTIIALRVHKTATVAPDRSDNYDAAAERKVVEKVRDLTDVLREFGPRFDVHVLDTEDEDFAEKIDALTRGDDRKGLRYALEHAPENSIFFAANGKFQRMGFNEFLLYDKTASKAEGADKSQRNLVLIPQGKEAFVNKLLALEQRKPVVGVAVVHSALSTRSESERIAMAGMRVALERNGFEVRDVILKNWGRQLTPAARTVGEDDFVRTEAQFNLYSLAVSQLETALRRREKAIVEAKKSLDAMDSALERRDQSTAIKHLETAVEVLQEFERRRIFTNAQAGIVLKTLEQSIPSIQQELVSYREKLNGIRPKYEEQMKNDKLLESRRPAEVKARFKQFVDSCDVLVVPRLTILQLSRGEAIQAWLQNWSAEQAEALKEYIAAGKPVLFALGATSGDKQRAGREVPDQYFDDILGRFGITLGEQAIFTDREGEVAAEADDDAFGRAVEVPAIHLDLRASATKPANPLTNAYIKSSRLVDGKLPIRRSGFRPIYLSEQAQRNLPFVGVIARTIAESWNEDRPLPEGEDYLPRFTPTKLGDPVKGTRDEERRGPFDVGVAIESPVPSDWLEPKLSAAQSTVVAGALANLGTGFPTGLPLAGLPSESFLPALRDSQKPKPPSVRLVVLGHGGLFNGEKTMVPGEEALLLHSLNWMLHREELLPHDVASGQEWKYPRVTLDAVQKSAWTGGAVALLPLTCAVFGVIVLMIRRFR